MSLFDRGITVLAGLVTALFGGLMIALALGWDAATVVGNLAYRAGMLWRGEVGFFGVLVLAAGAYTIVVALRRPREREAVLKETELGQVRVTLRAMETLVYRAARQVQGIKDVEVTLQPNADGVDVSLSLQVAPDLNIPQLTEEVQRGVEAYVRETVGLPTGRVHVEVRNVSQTVKSRVE